MKLATVYLPTDYLSADFLPSISQLSASRASLASFRLSLLDDSQSSRKGGFLS